MAFAAVLISAIYMSQCLIVEASYLDVPRIHFKGRYRADTNSRNNEKCNFNVNNKVLPDQEWNFNGTSEWQFLDMYITSVVGMNGLPENSNPLFGAIIQSNDNGPAAKIVDLDVDRQISSLFGLKVSIKSDDEVLLRGEWSVAIIVRDIWKRMPCGSTGGRNSFLGTISTSRITKIEWLSDKVDFLRRATDCVDCTGELAVSISLSYFNGETFTIGNIVGTIGIAKDGEPLNIGGSRKLLTTNPTLHPGITCQISSPWTNIAPAQYFEGRNVLALDISNTFPFDINNQPIDLGELWLGVKDRDSVQLFGQPIPYNETDIWTKGGVIEWEINDKTLQTLVRTKILVVAKEISKPAGSDDCVGENIYTSKSTFQHNHEQCALVLLKEEYYFVRPMGHYHDRLEYRNSKMSEHHMIMLVTAYGQPAQGVQVKVQERAVFPPDGVVVDENEKSTDAKGIATFTFKVNTPIPNLRHYNNTDCSHTPTFVSTSKFDRTKVGIPEKGDYQETLPIDGQVYDFCYYVGEGNCLDDTFFSGIATSQVISLLAFSTVEYEKPYAWVEDVFPIFNQYHHLHFVMRSILDMSSYSEVTKPHNIKLLQLAFQKDIHDPNYMPVTRDLSPTKMSMIRQWLERPCYRKEDCTTQTPICISPPPPTTVYYGPEESYTRCFEPITKSNKDVYYIGNFFHANDNDMLFSTEDTLRYTDGTDKPPRPLFGYKSGKEILFKSGRKYLPVCNKDLLKEQLQLGVQLEFSTLPLYLTSLYTIMENCNLEAYNLIRGIVMQEMLHFAQAANILIAIGGKVVIDDETVVPHYPVTGLPGGVLPGLTLTLEKYSLEHVRNNFMALEVPSELSNYTTELTIGEFYREIQRCLRILQSESDLFKNPRENWQVEWPWYTPAEVGTLYKVSDIDTAMMAIGEIIEQGEGARETDPVDQSTKQYAHFFRFEEIYCKHRLVVLPGHEGYNYSGAPIPYNPYGVWNMTTSLKVSDIIPESRCHTQAKAFHDVYRRLLRFLDEAFNGHPEKIETAVELMESLKVHAKKTLWTPLYDNAKEQEKEEKRCGPIWDYRWDPEK